MFGRLVEKLGILKRDNFGISTSFFLINEHQEYFLTGFHVGIHLSVDKLIAIVELDNVNFKKVAQLLKNLSRMDRRFCG